MPGDALVGRLTLRPGGVPPIVCERPMVRAALMHRLTAGRRASLLPDLIATVFALGGTAQRATARRAVRAALGAHDDARARTHDGCMLALYTAREHLQRLALDVPARAPQPGVAPDTAWLRDAPVLALPAQGPGPSDLALDDVQAGMPSWLERRLLGMPAARWLEGWQGDPAGWLQQWCEGRAHPVARWLAAAAAPARAIALPCRPLGLLDEGEAGLCGLGATLAGDADFAERPCWQGAPAETGPWTRRGHTLAPATPWERLGARLADLARIALGARLDYGALQLQPGEGIAWSEMSRGLLVHWVRLEPQARSRDAAHAQTYRVLAPTEWNFHPDGGLGAALRAQRLDETQARLAALALDPCIEFDVAACSCTR